MEILLYIGIILSIIWMIFASFNRFSVLLSAPVAAVIVLLFGGEPLMKWLFGQDGSYVFYLGEFIRDFFFIFVLGSVMAKYLQLSGAIESISTSAVKIIDVKNPMHGLVMVFFITSLLTYGGVSLFVVMFAAVPLAKSLFYEMNIPWKLAPLPIILGLGTFTAGTLPGSPSVINVIPTKTLGTDLTAGTTAGFVGSIVMVAVSIIYMRFALKSELKKNQYVPIDKVESDNNQKIPGLFKALSPILLLIGMILVGSAFQIENILVISLVVVIIIEMVLFHPFITSHVYVLNSGTQDALMPLLSTASTIAYGSLIAKNAQVSSLTSRIMERSKMKLFMASLLTVVYSVITASASGAIGIIMSTQGTYLQTLGLPKDTIHRVLATATTLLPNVPHSGVVIALLTLSSLSHKEAFKHVFWGPFVVGVFGLATTMILST